MNKIFKVVAWSQPQEIQTQNQDGAYFFLLQGV